MTKSRPAPSRRRAKAPAPLPVTLLSGFLGSGKTTLLMHILRNKEGLRCAVIVNDMAELNIDASLVQKGSVIQAEEKLVQMQNGCICCTLRDDLLQEVGRLAQQRRFDYIIIENTGIGEPMQVAETFELSLGEGAPPLKEVARLDTCVTVLDAATLLDNMTSLETVKDRREGVDEGDERGVADLLLDQVEFANVVLLNKTDLVAPQEAERLAACLRRLNPGARVIPTRNAKVPLKQVLNTRLFNFEEAAQSSGWMQSLTEKHTPETEEYGISSFVYRARRPFHPQRFWDFLQTHFKVQEVQEEEEEEEEEEEDGADAGAAPPLQPAPRPSVGDAEQQAGGISPAEAAAKRAALHKNFGQVLRGKGFFWLSTRPDMSGELSLAGGIARVGCAGPWFAAMPEEVWPDVDPDKVRLDFDPEIGDRRQELVFIGIGVKQNALTAALDACLCTPEEAASSSPPSSFLDWPEMELVEVTDEEEDSDGSSSESDGEKPGAGSRVTSNAGQRAAQAAGARARGKRRQRDGEARSQGAGRAAAGGGMGEGAQRSRAGAKTRGGAKQGREALAGDTARKGPAGKKGRRQ